MLRCGGASLIYKVLVTYSKLEPAVTVYATTSSLPLPSVISLRDGDEVKN